MLFSERLKELRGEHGITQDQLSEKTGLSHGCIAMLEVEKRTPTAQTLNALADYFGVTTDYLLGRTDDDSIVFSKNTPAPLPADQQELNILFQSLAPGYRTQVLEYARYMAERSGVNLKNTKKRG